MTIFLILISHKIPLGLTRSKTAIGIHYDITESKLLSEQNRLARNKTIPAKWIQITELVCRSSRFTLCHVPLSGFFWE